MKIESLVYNYNQNDPSHVHSSKILNIHTQENVSYNTLKNKVCSISFSSGSFVGHYSKTTALKVAFLFTAYLESIYSIFFKSQTQLSQTQLSQTQLSQTQLSQTQLSQTQLSQTQLSQTQLSQDNVENIHSLRVSSHDEHEEQVKGDIEEYYSYLCKHDKNAKELIEKKRVEIDQFIESEGLFTDSSIEQKCMYAERALSTYSSSLMHYSPVVLQWAQNVLETAVARRNEEGKPFKVAFMARDGIPAYEAAKILKEVYPEFKDIDIVVLHISRKLQESIYPTEDTFNKLSSKEKVGELKSQLTHDGHIGYLSDKRDEFIEYVMEQEKLFVEGENVLFTDIGFTGSKMPNQKHLLKDNLGKTDYGFLISRTKLTPDKSNPYDVFAHGILSKDSENDKVHGWLKAIGFTAGGKKSSHWLEDAHQGTQNSTVSLARDSSRKIVRQFTDGKETCKDSDNESYLNKHFGLQGIINGVKDLTDRKDLKSDYLMDSQSCGPQAWRMIDPAVREHFDDFLVRLNEGKRVSFVKHI